ncbi:hypothetical protein E2562_008247 [Oryza meyeriana var. granulata]|uniref:F-box domain-containing protein n=1 Tax=Oryza meyeriana var. granulata TaxID=110450 RepID=A0A6G1DG32_9ORYZ|nr:hypothetical protein E2562_008247 [Oryza meyeriana var. granulata]
MGQCPSTSHHHRKQSQPPSPSQATQAPLPTPTATEDAPTAEDITPPSSPRSSWHDLKRCSLVCRCWLVVEASSRLWLALDAQALLHAMLPGILARFPTVSKLALKCDHRSESIGNPTLTLVTNCLGPGLRRLKLRSLRIITDDGVAVLAAAATNLHKLSVSSCAFGAKGIEAILRSCLHLKELSIKHLSCHSHARAGPDAGRSDHTRTHGI